jgi:tRNA(adenine34) deaminase
MNRESKKFSPEILWHMQSCLEHARKAESHGEVPIAALIFDADGKVLALEHNQKETIHDCTAHAEVIAIRSASLKLKNWRLTGCTLVTTLEPCIMCLSAMVHARIEHCVFGAYDKKGGALSLNYCLHQDARLNHQFSITGGLMHYENSAYLSSFFRQRRKGHQFAKD